MKILNIRFKNINSLEGEHRIDFEQPPFTDSGVFAITGPNGSGKSSILDAITLALYGEIFRFDLPAQHVMTKHTAECFSEIEFAIGQERYRSSWSVKREGDRPRSPLLPTEMHLARLNPFEVKLAENPAQVRNKLIEISGMNFRNFTRSILLAQGDFAGFLNALDNERMDILEKLIGTDIYADYKQEVTQKQAEANKQLTFLQQDLAAVPLISPESLEACNLDLADFNDQVVEFQEEINRIGQQKAIFEQIDQCKSAITTEEQKLQHAISQQLALKKSLERIAASEQASQFKDDLAAIAEHKGKLDQQTGALNALKNELKQIEGTLAIPGYNINSPEVQSKLAAQAEQGFDGQKQAVDGLRSQANLVNANWQSEIILQKSLDDQIAEKQSELAGVNLWLEEHPADLVLLDKFPDVVHLKNLRQTATELEAGKRELEQWSKSTFTNLNKLKGGLESRNKNLEKLQSEMTAEQEYLVDIAEDNTIEQMEELLEEQQERVNDYEELVNLAVANENLKPKPTFFTRLFKKPEEPIRHADELETELETLREQLKREENIRLALERAVFNDVQLARMANEREHLVDGKPCPLCGATEHPYAKYLPAPSNSEQALNDQRIKIKRVTVRIAEMDDLLKFSKRRAERSQINKVQLQKVSGRWQSLCNKLNMAGEDFDIEKIEEMRRRLKDESTELRNITNLINNHKNTQKRIAKLAEDIEKTKLTIGQMQTAIAKVESEWQTEPQKMAETNNSIAKLHQDLSNLTTAITEGLAQLDEVLPQPGKEDAVISRLNLRRNDSRAYIDRKKVLANELALLDSKKTAGQNQINNYKSQLDAVSGQLHLEEVVGLHFALVEKQKLIADKELQVNQLTAEAEQQTQALDARMRGTLFNTLDEIRNALAQLDNHDQLADQKANVDEEILLLGKEIDQLYAELEKLESTDKPELPSEELDLQIKSLHEKMGLAQMEATRLEAVVREQDQCKAKHATLMAKLEDQQVLVSQANAEVEALTAQNGMAFRCRVQDKMVENLLSQTNAILEKISGRYYLRRQESAQGLALVVEDTFQGNEQRLPKTLSGGESFVVSLALALGLSELASNGKSVDSLFLDEGFGNLDAESLFTVINTLESLRAHGKTVGVISHVEAVQKRFKAQLQLHKKPNGLGELRKVS